MNQNHKTAPIFLSVDTGGTFTDCIALLPEGRQKRCKVLSNRSIRGYARKTSEDNVVSINLNIQIHKTGFFNGFKFRLLKKGKQSFTVIHSDPEKNTLTLDGRIDLSGDALIPCEILSPEEAPVLAARIITNTGIGEPFPPLQFRLSTTKGTNALLERNGGKTLFLITKGFKDLLKIKNQQRPDLFSLNIEKPEPYYRHIIEVPERLDAEGKVLKKPDLKSLQKKIKPLLNEIDAAAICLMHSYLNPEHEILIEMLLNDLGVPFVSRSSKLSPSIKIVPRAVTADVDAYLTPVMQRYLNRISETIGQAPLRIMNSAGNLVDANYYTPKDGLFSGPAGGVIGAAAVAKKALSADLSGFENLPDLSKSSQNIISFDMGGTSTDVSRYDGGVDYIFEHTVGDATLSSPAIDIETVAAGGGSICDFDGKSLTAGPESAGADPGPACYGKGGPLTITDVNLLSGRLHPSNFQISIDTAAAEQALEKLMRSVNKNRNKPLSREEVLEGFFDIANERMAQAIRKISIQKGFDPAEYTLVAFGGAGAQHALSVADKLDIRTVLVPSDAGLLSAVGLQEARLEYIASRQVLENLYDVQPNLEEWIAELQNNAATGLEQQGVDPGSIQILRSQLYLRLKGQDTPLEISWNGVNQVHKQFQEAYISRYGHWIENREIELEAIRVLASEKKIEEKEFVPDFDEAPAKTSPAGETHILFNKTKHASPVYHRESLKPGTEITGPALILDPHSTTVIEPGWSGRLLAVGTWIIQKMNLAENKNQAGEGRSEEVQLQLYTNRFTSIAEQMGEMLQRTALSVNIKERLDFSCALLDADGYLVVNAPHIPVHLGAMGTCVRTVIKHIEQDLTGFENPPTGGTGLEEGDILITNHPGFGGSHLPDITVITPVFYLGKLAAFVANRAHHAEIGGKSPGSMPPDATCLAEEGVVISPTFLARNGKFYWDDVRQLLKHAPWPSRSVEENMADLRASVAANHRGVAEFIKLADTFGIENVRLYMQKLKSYASDRLKAALNKIENGNYQAEEKLDDGSLLKVNCRVDDDSLRIDFSGTSGVHPGNLNANPSIVNSVIMYVLRLMIDEPLPLNDGLLEPVEITIPTGMLNPVFENDPEKSPAVVGGNVETSQRLTDTLLKAFEMAACSYGTMNNVLFGNNRFGYYETVAGGTGAGYGFDGADAVHQHMTNTRAADPEILEHRYPVRLDHYGIRNKSSGAGRWSGGRGVVRKITFLEPVRLSVLSQHRNVAPYGLRDGQPGKSGKQWIEHSNGQKTKLGWIDGADIKPGDSFILKTPGGGGYGKKPK